eukprot:CAMPEP_0113243862 /NCGR_PEP_ID=MMETSP0008_2-20120614/8093_1 /TAXON_ID=97485 /ORGANISM="Prymnesium parvum" /LENGTH=143 /DNA_ID=CAMNT_0000091439 /DNA_START=356 /DNA_END=789 /DNA_ORIENTATION=+ /assembly_acc=CAM_ASM_000153
MAWLCKKQLASGTASDLYMLSALARAWGLGLFSTSNLRRGMASPLLTSSNFGGLTSHDQDAIDIHLCDCEQTTLTWQQDSHDEPVTLPEHVTLNGPDHGPTAVAELHNAMPPAAVGLPSVLPTHTSNAPSLAAPQPPPTSERA